VRGLCVAIVLATACGRLGFEARSVVPGSHTFMYVVDGYNSMNTKTTLRILEVADDGSLAEAASSPFDLGAQPFALRATDDGARLFVTSGQTEQLYVLAIDGSTGALTMIDQQPVAMYPSMIGLHPNGRWIYVPDWTGSGQIHGFEVAADGHLTAITGSPFAFTGPFDWVEVHPNGRWAYIVDNGSGFISALAIDQSSGALSMLGVPSWDTTDPSPYAALIDATGRYGYIANDLSSGVPAFTIDTATGAMSTTPGSKFGYAANTCMYVAMNRARTRFFLADDGSGLDALVAYRIDATTGALVALAGSPLATDNIMWGVATSPVSNDVYTTTARAIPAIRHFRADDTRVTFVDDYVFPDLAYADVIAIAHPP